MPKGEGIFLVMLVGLIKQHGKLEFVVQPHLPLPLGEVPP